MKYHAQYICTNCKPLKLCAGSQTMTADNWNDAAEDLVHLVEAVCTQEDPKIEIKIMELLATDLLAPPPEEIT